MKYSEATEVVERTTVGNGESSIQRQLEQFSELILLFILEVIKRKKTATRSAVTSAVVSGV